MNKSGPGADGNSGCSNCGKRGHKGSARRKDRMARPGSPSWCVYGHCSYVCVNFGTVFLFFYSTVYTKGRRAHCNPVEAKLLHFTSLYFSSLPFESLDFTSIKSHNIFVRTCVRVHAHPLQNDSSPKRCRMPWSESLKSSLKYQADIFESSPFLSGDCVQRIRALIFFDALDSGASGHERGSCAV